MSKPKLKHDQKTYAGRPTGWSVLEALWDSGRDGSNEELSALAQITPSTVTSYRRKYLYDRGQGHKDPHSFYPVQEGELPLRTIRGWVWCIPKTEGKMECKECELYELCQEAVKGEGYVGCEQVLTSELLPGYEYKEEK